MSEYSSRNALCFNTIILPLCFTPIVPRVLIGSVELINTFFVFEKQWEAGIAVHSGKSTSMCYYMLTLYCLACRLCRLMALPTDDGTMASCVVFKVWMKCQPETHVVLAASVACKHCVFTHVLRTMVLLVMIDQSGHDRDESVDHLSTIFAPLHPCQAGTILS